jgi:hypothetical protein
MFISLLLILLVTFSGTVLTYLYEREDSLLVRLCAGNVIGSSIFGLIIFLLASLFGFSVTIVLVSLLLALAPLVLLAKKNFQKSLRRDWQRARDKLQGGSLKKFFRFAYYAGFFILFWLFFERVMIETSAGIFTGGSQNLGDLPFHLGAIFSFTDGQNFPPQNPSFANAKFSYPFIADLITAATVALGAKVRDAMLVQNVLLAFSLLVILERFTFKLTGSRLAGKFAPVLLFFSGGLGFLSFVKDYWEGTQSFFDFIWKLPRDYTIGEKYRWGNALVTLFITQRSLLLGMPLTLIVLGKLWDLFNSRETEKINRDGQDKQDKKAFSTFRFPFSIFLVGLLAGMLPLIHAHSLFALFIVCAFLFFFSLEEKWREWLAFAVGVSLVAIPELIWIMTGSASRLTEFIDWHFGWDKGETNFFWFWLKNTGVFIPTLVLGAYLIWKGTRDKGRGTRGENRQAKGKKRNQEQEKPLSLVSRPLSLLIFYLPFLFCFILTNAVKLAPWEWDNIKVLVYWFVGSIPFVALVLAWIYNQGKIFRWFAALFLIVLTAAGAIDVWRVVTAQINYKVFEPDAIKIAEQIKQRTAPNALFLHAPTYNSAVVLSGRRSLMRYLGHLSSYGIDYAEREKDLQRIYEGAATADIFLKKYDIEYVLVSPEEYEYFSQNSLVPNAAFLQKFPVIAESGQYRVYKVK